MMMRRRWVAAALTGALAIAACGTGTPSGAYYRPDLTDDRVAQMTPGITAIKVTAVLGEPYRRTRFHNVQATAWEYRYRDTWGYWVDLAVMVNDAGYVREVVKRRIDPPGAQ